MAPRRRTARVWLGAIALLVVAGCENKKAPAEKAGEAAEKAAESAAARAGEGPLDRHVAGEVAEERAELAVDVGASDAEVKRLEGKPAETAAEDLQKPDSGAY